MMAFTFLGIDFVFTTGRVIWAAILAGYVLFGYHIWKSFRYYQPFKRDQVANASIFFLHTIRKDFLRMFGEYFKEDFSEFYEKMERVEAIYGLEKMQNSQHRAMCQAILHEKYEILSNAYSFVQKTLNDQKALLEDLEEFMKVMTDVYDDMLKKQENSQHVSKVA